MKFAASLIVFLIVVVSIVFFVVWFPHLPDRVPSRFGAGGEILQTMTRENYVMLMGGIILGVLILFSWIIPLLINVLPTSLINMPNREYWLSAERRGESIKRVADHLRWIAIATALLFLALTQLTFEVTVGIRDSISPLFGIAMAVYSIAITILVCWLLFCFRMPKSETGVSRH